MAGQTYPRTEDAQMLSVLALMGDAAHERRYTGLLAQEQELEELCLTRLR